MSQPYDPNQPQNPYPPQQYDPNQQNYGQPPQNYGQPPMNQPNYGQPQYPPQQQNYGQPPANQPNYGPPGTYTPPKSAGIGIPELLQGSIATVTQPSNPPFGVVRGRGNLVMSIVYVFVGAVLGGLLISLINLVRDYPSPWSSTVSSGLGHTLGFVAFVFIVAKMLKLSGTQRDEFASAAAMFWIPVIVIAALLTGILSLMGFNAIISLGALVSGGTLLVLFGLSLLAVKMLFGNAYEQSFKPVAISILGWIAATSLVNLLFNSL